MATVEGDDRLKKKEKRKKKKGIGNDINDEMQLEFWPILLQSFHYYIYIIYIMRSITSIMFSQYFYNKLYVVSCY